MVIYSYYFPKNTLIPETLTHRYCDNDETAITVTNIIMYKSKIAL